MGVYKTIDAVAQKALSLDRRLLASDSRTYLYLCWSPPGTMSYHARVRGIPRETFRRSINRLKAHGWLISRPAERGMIVTPWMPSEVEELVVEKLKTDRERVNFMGEWLMKGLLDLTAYDRDYANNVRPDWLVMGDGSGRLELDRLYPSAKVAFEFQGPQHRRITALTPTQSDLDEQIMRDHIKASLCNTAGLRLIPITARDLNFPAMREKIAGLLPPATIRENGPLYRYMEQLCRGYANNVARHEK